MNTNDTVSRFESVALVAVFVVLGIICLSAVGILTLAIEVLSR
jgi:hypothetical protein